MWFTATVPSGTYFAIGFGKSMKNTGMIFMSGDGSTQGLFATTEAQPPVDTTQNFKVESLVKLPDGS